MVGKMMNELANPQSLLGVYWLTVFASFFSLCVSIAHRELGHERLSKVLGAAWLLMSILLLAAFGYHASRQVLYCQTLLQKPEALAPGREISLPHADETRDVFAVHLPSGKQIEWERRTH